VQRIEEIAIEGEQVHKEWEASWQEPIAPSAETVATVATAPAAIGENDEPPNRGDNGHRRVQPTAAKKLMLSLVSVKCLVSDVPASNFDRNELEIAGELSLAIGGFVIPWRGGARQSRIQDYQRAFSVSRGSSSTTAKSQSRQNENQTTGERTTFDAKRQSRLDAFAPSQKSDGPIKNLSILLNRTYLRFKNAQNDPFRFKSTGSTSHRSRHCHCPIN
jgi:hypothetical protein